jgi:hypothetical protein
MLLLWFLFIALVSFFFFFVFSFILEVRWSLTYLYFFNEICVFLENFMNILHESWSSPSSYCHVG